MSGRSWPDQRYFNPRAPRGARPYRSYLLTVPQGYFNPRAPRGARLLCAIPSKSFSQFQSTRSARSATGLSGRSWPDQRYFNPRAPRGARPYRSYLLTVPQGYFNPRAPRGARLLCAIPSKSFSQFQSTRSARSATHRGHTGYAGLGISIHALREERAAAAISCIRDGVNFNPRAPRGARLMETTPSS